jgi:hypothetical protein
MIAMPVFTVCAIGAASVWGDAHHSGRERGLDQSATDAGESGKERRRTGRQQPGPHRHG